MIETLIFVTLCLDWTHPNCGPDSNQEYNLALNYPTHTPKFLATYITHLQTETQPHFTLPLTITTTTTVTVMAQGAILITATLLPLLLTLFFFSSISHAHNITSILAKHPQFSTFNHYLTITHLAAEINRRQTITVLALDNAAMSSLLSKQYSVYTLRNVLSLHVLTDYFGSKKLHQITNGTALTSSMFQATGSASGSSGYVNITDLKGGKVGFGTEDNEGKLDASYVKSLLEMPYNISVLQISQVVNY